MVIKVFVSYSDKPEVWTTKLNGADDIAFIDDYVVVMHGDDPIAAYNNKVVNHIEFVKDPVSATSCKENKEPKYDFNKLNEKPSEYKNDKKYSKEFVDEFSKDFFNILDSLIFGETIGGSNG